MSKKCIIYLSFIAFFMFDWAVAYERGVGVQAILNTSGEEVLLYEHSYALVVGVSDYSDWPDLPGVIEDVLSIKSALSKNGFEVQYMKDPNGRDLVRALDDFIYKYGQSENNRLLFYFAGHGHTVELTYGDDMGFIVPADAPHPDINRNKFMQKAIDMETFISHSKRIQSKHALFIFDSCFSGSIFDLSRAIPKSITELTAEPVRQFITSGREDQTVPDKSIFRPELIEALNGEADNNRDGFITGTELGEFLQKQVYHYSKGAQKPQYGKIRHQGLDKGDFVFKVFEQVDTDNRTELFDIDGLLNNIQNKLSDLQYKNEIDCNSLKEFIQDFESNGRQHLERSTSSAEADKVRMIDMHIKNLTNKLKKCSLPYYDECKCIQQ